MLVSAPDKFVAVSKEQFLQLAATAKPITEKAEKKTATTGHYMAPAFRDPDNHRDRL
jgi:hypothetical protein